MSGPKDYSFVYEAALLARRLAALQRRQRQRATATQNRLDKQCRIAQQRVASLQSERGAATRASLEQRRREAQRLATAAGKAASPQRKPKFTNAAKDENFERLLNKAREELASLKAIIGNAMETREIVDFEDELQSLEGGSKSAPPTDSHIEQLCEHIEVARANAQERAEQLKVRLESLVAWQVALAEDDNVHQFRERESAAWQRAAEGLLREHGEGIALDAGLARAAKMIEEAQSVHDEACDCRGKFELRNELLKDVISSLKEIGFFVEDPIFEDSSNPGGPVIVKAVRGSEEVTTRLDLSDKVQSVWNGMADEHCSESFFAYVDKMKERGLSIEAERPDLQRRPILKHKGARELPRNKTGEIGN